MVDVNTQNKTISVNVSSSGVSSNVNASGDYSYYYSEKAREWAISNRIVDGVDYSSKYYANKSNQSALNAQSFAQSAQDSYNNFQQSVDGALSNIDSAVQGAVDDINNTKTEIINDIELVANGEKQEIEDLIDTGKDELKEAIGDVKVLTTLEIGDIGFTQMAIDESNGKRRILNGQLIIQEQYVQLTNIIKNSVSLNPSLACTESEWQAAVIMSTNGVCDKFVIDDEAGTIRLPKYPEYFDIGIDGTKTVAVYGTGKALGMTDGTTNFGTRAYTGVTAIYGYRSSYNANVGAISSTNGGITDAATLGVVTNPATSGLTGSVTTSSEQIKGTYFIQVATGAETEDNIINEIELNNPFFFGMSQYFESEPNNISWLKSTGQYNSKAVYPSYYDWLLKVYNGTEIVEGVSVKLSTEDYTDYDFVLNTAEETFRLPLLDGSEDLVNYDNSTTYTAEFIAPSNGYLISRSHTDAYGTVNLRQDGHIISSAHNNTGAGTILVISEGFCSKSGVITKDGQSLWGDIVFYPLKGNGSLYFYVGETVQNANLINAGRIEEKVADLIPNNASLISSYAMPDISRAVKVSSSPANGSTFTAPSDGIFCLYAVGNTNTDICQIGIYNGGNSTTAPFANTNTVTTYGAFTVYSPVSKGETVMIYTYKVTFTWSGYTNLGLWFIPTKGGQ